MLQLNGVYQWVVANELPDGSFEKVERLVRVHQLHGDYAYVGPATLAYFTPEWVADAEQVLQVLDEPAPTFRYTHGLVTFA